ncbi:MAG TPA: PEP-CTERM sorting domain-containing protein [Myxococcota bacterium]
MRRLSKLILTAALALPLASQALTLQDLNAGATFSSSGGELSFDFAAGSIALSGVLPSDLTQYTVLPTAVGFAVSGPLAAIGPAAFGGLTLAYRVSASPGFALTGASLQASGLAFGPGAFAIASSGLSNGAGLGVLLASGGGTGATSNSAFSAQSILDALGGLQLFALTPGDVAAFGSVQHGFSWIALPEPGTALLLGAGLLGLGVFGSRRRPLAA